MSCKTYLTCQQCQHDTKPASTVVNCKRVQDGSIDQTYTLLIWWSIRLTNKWSDIRLAEHCRLKVEIQATSRPYQP